MTGLPPRRPLAPAEAAAIVARERPRAVILVEGWSDEAAVAAWARRRGVALAASGVVILPTGGVTNLGRFAAAARDADPAIRLAGLYDATEQAQALRTLARAGVGVGTTGESAEAAGFFRCDADLEDELIRAVGTDAVARLLAAHDELASFERFRVQPGQRGREAHPLLKRFMGTRAGRKERYGALLVEALAPDDVPRPLQRVLAQALA